MPKSKRQLKAILPVLERGGERSSLFWWMLDHHDEMVAAANGRRPRWKQLCTKFEGLGLTDGFGKPPSPEAARRTWRHVRKLAADKPKADEAPGRKPPSRISPDWRPQEATPPPHAAQSVPGKAVAPTADEHIARLRRAMAERSGRQM
ncbi:MAG: hypothetical protein J0H14_06935 [Alphaproteobacteria bacterium]|nr:hypothetical protein [Alphaproteobacteria bacterium]